MRIDKTLRRKGVHTSVLTKSVGYKVKPIKLPKITKLKLPKLPGFSPYQ